MTLRVGSDWGVMWLKYRLAIRVSPPYERWPIRVNVLGSNELADEGSLKNPSGTSTDPVLLVQRLEENSLISRVVLNYNLVARSYSLLGPAFESMLLKSVHLTSQVNLVSTHLMAYYGHIKKECNETGIKHINANPLQAFERVNRDQTLH